MSKHLEHIRQMAKEITAIGYGEDAVMAAGYQWTIDVGDYSSSIHAYLPYHAFTVAWSFEVESLDGNGVRDLKLAALGFVVSEYLKHN